MTSETRIIVRTRSQYTLENDLTNYSESEYRALFRRIRWPDTGFKVINRRSFGEHVPMVFHCVFITLPKRISRVANLRAKELNYSALGVARKHNSVFEIRTDGFLSLGVRVEYILSVFEVFR